MTEITDTIDDRVLRTVDAIQVENPWMHEYVRNLNRGRDVDVRYAPPGNNARLFCPAPERNSRNDPYVLCVGRLDDPRKNIDLLLDAYALIPEHIRSRSRLVLAGQAAPPESFWQRVESLGVRKWIDFFHRPTLPELLALYQHACMFVLPSDEEGLGVVLLEAMACGIPVVSTRSGGPDGIIIDGDNGYLVPLDDTVVLAERMGRLLSDEGLNRRLGQRARATIEQWYTDEIAGRPFLDVWERLLHKAGKA